jgi:plasmid stability protein
MVVPTLSVRKIDTDVYERLRVRAAEHGVSMEEEVRRILRRAVSAPERLGDLALHYFGAKGVELELPTREPHEPIELGE